VSILVARVLATPMTNSLVLVAPSLQPSIDVVLVGVDQTARRDRGLDDRLDGLLLDIGQHLQHDLAATLDQAEDRRLVLFQRAAARRAGQAPSPPKAPLFAT